MFGEIWSVINDKIITSQSKDRADWNMIKHTEDLSKFK